MCFSNAFLLTFASLLLITHENRLVQLEKAYFLILFTFEGIEQLERLVHPLNSPSGRTVKSAGKVNCFSFLQPEKEYSPIEFRVYIRGIIISEIFSQPSKACFSIFTTEDSIQMSLSE